MLPHGPTTTPLGRGLLLALLAGGLLACGGSADAPGQDAGFAPVQTEPAVGAALVKDSALGGLVAGAPAPEGPGELPVEPPLEPPPGGEPGEPGVAQAIAYTHSLGLRLPVAEVEPLLQAHTAACRNAGPATCIIISSWTNRPAEDWVSAGLNVKATPAFIEAFLAGVEAPVTAAGGEVTARATNAQDLTRQIIDSEARLNAQVALRRRLEGLLATREAKLGDLLGIERELARVTAEIESMTAALRGLRLRVALSDLTISYETRARAVTASTFEPLTSALSGFLRTFLAALGAVITAFAAGLPWLLLAGVSLWIWVKLVWPRIRRR